MATDRITAQLRIDNARAQLEASIARLAERYILTYRATTIGTPRLLERPHLAAADLIERVAEFVIAVDNATKAELDPAAPDFVPGHAGGLDSSF
jgi:hypothetical protein